MPASWGLAPAFVMPDLISLTTCSLLLSSHDPRMGRASPLQLSPFHNAIERFELFRI